MSVNQTAASDVPQVNRWAQLVVGIICMVMIANLQYGWTYFVVPMNEAHNWGIPAIQVAFSLFVLTETWLIPIEGWFVDKYGPRIVVVAGGILVAIGWIMNAYADTLFLLYAAAIVSGIGAGCVYGTCVGNALKWFGDKRGLAAGLTAMGFGGGAAATVIPIIYVIETYGYQSAFLWFGIGQGAIVLLLAPFLRAPHPSQIKTSPKKKVNQSLRNFTPGEMLKTPLFWVLYVMFTMVAAGGLMATAQLGPIARDFGLDRIEIVFLGIAGTTLVVAGIVDNILNGVARPFFGWVSDQIGREITMFIAFSLGAFSLWAWSISPGARSTACSQPPAPMLSARNMPRPMPVSSTPPRARPRSSAARSRPSCSLWRAVGSSCSGSPPAWMRWRPSWRSSCSSRCSARTPVATRRLRKPPPKPRSKRPAYDVEAFPVRGRLLRFGGSARLPARAKSRISDEATPA
jgi:OFA family oxalate/formate antiporter-like MFS transporter